MSRPLTQEEIEQVTKKEERELEVTRYCAWCGNQIQPHKRKHAIYCSDECRQLAYHAKKCYYCGQPAESRDHFVPRAFKRRIQDFAVARNSNVIVPACLECNCTAGSKVFQTLNEKRQYIKNRYRVKYKKILNAPDWTEKELGELGHSMQTYVRGCQTAKAITKARIRWPRR